MTTTTNDIKRTLTRLPKAERIAKEIDEIGQWNPVRMAFEIRFGDGNRRITAADLERAAEAGMIAIRASLAGRHPAYTIASIRCKLEYLYVQTQRMING